VNSEPEVNLTLTLNLRNPLRGKGSQNQISEIPSVDLTEMEQSRIKRSDVWLRSHSHGDNTRREGRRIPHIRRAVIRNAQHPYAYY